MCAQPLGSGRPDPADGIHRMGDSSNSSHTMATNIYAEISNVVKEDFNSGNQAQLKADIGGMSDMLFANNSSGGPTQAMMEKLRYQSGDITEAQINTLLSTAKNDLENGSTTTDYDLSQTLAMYPSGNSPGDSSIEDQLDDAISEGKKGIGQLNQIIRNLNMLLQFANGGGKTNLASDIEGINYSIGLIIGDINNGSMDDANKKANTIAQTTNSEAFGDEIMKACGGPYT